MYFIVCLSSTFFQARLPLVELDFWGSLVQKSSLMFQLLISHGILTCGMEKMVYLLFGGSETSTVLADKTFPCEKEGVS